MSSSSEPVTLCKTIYWTIHMNKFTAGIKLFMCICMLVSTVLVEFYCASGFTDHTYTAQNLLKI